jgi:AhpD family alkylhydroperoxidase
MSVSLPNPMSYPEQSKHIKRNMTILREGIPKVMASFGALHESASTDAALDAKTKELIALAIPVASRCDGCIAFHTHDALHAGATRQEIAEAVGVAVLMGGGPSVMYAAHVVDAVDQFQADSP